MTQNKSKNTKAKSPPKPKVFDVSHPGGSAPNSSGRPLIVTHRPMVQDPMVTKLPVEDPLAPAEGAVPIEAPKALLKPQKIKLQPSPEAIQELAEQAVSEDKEETSAETSKEPELPLEKASLPITVAEDEPVSVAVKTTPPTSSPQSSLVASKEDTAEPETPVKSDAPAKNNAAADQAAAKKEADADAERQEEYSQIIDSRKYYVHISSPAKKRSMRLAVIGAVLIILVAIGCADAMLDAGIIDISGIPHTNFIQ